MLRFDYFILSILVESYGSYELNKIWAILGLFHGIKAKFDYRLKFIIKLKQKYFYQGKMW